MQLHLLTKNELSTTHLNLLTTTKQHFCSLEKYSKELFITKKVTTLSTQQQLTINSKTTNENDNQSNLKTKSEATLFAQSTNKNKRSNLHNQNAKSSSQKTKLDIDKRFKQLQLLLNTQAKQAKQAKNGQFEQSKQKFESLKKLLFTV